MPVNISSLFDRPEHVVRCAVGGCEKHGLRSEVCRECREYRCPAHVYSPIQGAAASPERVTFVDPDGSEYCSGCGNQLSSVGITKVSAKEGVDVPLAALKAAMEKNRLRKEFAPLLFNRFHELLEQLDRIESFLEKQLWAGLYLRGLDRYLEPQVDIKDYNGNFVARVDFASTLLRVAIFTDGHEFHDLPKRQEKDRKQTGQLQQMGWLVKRYWYEEVFPQINPCVDEIYDIISKRIMRMQDTGLPITGDVDLFGAGGGAAVPVPAAAAPAAVVAPVEGDSGNG